MEKTIFLCEDSTDGIFSGVYDGWASRLGHENIALQIQGSGNYELFANYMEVPTDGEKAYKVARTIRQRFKEEDYDAIYRACLSSEEQKADAIYQTIVLGMANVTGRPIIQNISNPSVCEVFELARAVGNEVHRYLGFVRFQELQNRVLGAVIEPVNQVLPLLADHFVNRFPGESFWIFDQTHKVFLVHEAHKPWALVWGQSLDVKLFEESSQYEQEFQRLWKGFCKSVAIKERKNLRLQQQLLPLRFRGNMLEL